MSAPTARLEQRARVQLDDFPVDAAWSADHRSLMIAGGEGGVLLLDVVCAMTGNAGAVTRLGEHAGGALAVSAQRAGALFASSGQDGAVKLWDVHSRAAQPIYSTNQWVEHLAFAQHGRLLAAAAGKALAVIDVATGAVRHVFDEQPGVIAALDWRPKSSTIAAAGNGGALIHQLEPRLETREYAWSGAALTASWSPDGRTLASGQQDGSVHLWYVAAGTQSQMKGYGVKVALTDWSANGRYLATAAGAALVVWEFGGKGPEGRKPLDLRAHSARMQALAFRPAGTWLATTARDRRLLLWRIGQGEQPLDAQLLPAECSVLRWSNDGRILAAADANGGVSLFEFVA